MASLPAASPQSRVLAKPIRWTPTTPRRAASATGASSSRWAAKASSRRNRNSSEGCRWRSRHRHHQGSSGFIGRSQLLSSVAGRLASRPVFFARGEWRAQNAPGGNTVRGSHRIASAIFGMCLLWNVGAAARTPASAVRPEPSQRPLVLVDQVGHATSAATRAVVQGSGSDTFTRFKVIDARTGEPVLQGTPKAAGRIDHWNDWRYWTIDFSALKTPGTYRVEVDGSADAFSFRFRISDDVLARYTLSNIIYYFKGQRITGDFD